MDSLFTEALFNQDGRHRVCGRLLHPFSLYDALLLQVDDNALYPGRESIQWADLLSAVLICSREPEEYLSCQHGKAQLALDFCWGVWVQRRYNLEKEIEKFFLYRADYDSSPEYWTDDSAEGGGRCKAPWVYSVASFIEAHSNMTEREILTAPIGKMMWKSATIAEFLGTSKSELISETERAAMKELGLR